MAISRRALLGAAAAIPLGSRLVEAQKGPARPEAVEMLTPDQFPAIAMNHLGFVPGAKKSVVYRDAGQDAPAEFTIREIGSPPKPFRENRKLERVATDIIECLVGDISDVQREGMYQVTVGAERSVPFFIRPDVWRRTLPKAVSYHKAQRCGVAVPNVHPACHLDDARRRDNGEHVDVTGGWHDAGDLRKWMTATQMNAIGLLRLARNLGEQWDLAGSGLAPLREEVRWGNRYFLKMQDKDGQVWADTAGGLNGDNSDNHWTDNKTGTADDRYINSAKGGMAQPQFVAIQGGMAQLFKTADAEYARQCLAAGVRCWGAAKRGGGARDLGWWILAALELRRATGREEYGDAAAEFGARLLGLQTTDFIAGQKEIRGFFRSYENDTTPLAEAVYSGIPGIALLELAAALPKHRDAPRWRDAVKMHLEEYAVPMTGHSPFDVMPYGIFVGNPTADVYRPLAGEVTYRYFMPCRKQFWWLGTTSHIESYAVLFAMAAPVFKKSAYRNLAFRQLEWVMGANPFGACLMTGEGMRNPYPHSRYVGLIPGGIVNGIAGNAKDEPILDMEYGLDWRTAEYWSPHNAYYLWAVSTLEHFA